MEVSMKKIFSLLAILTVFSLTAPAFAAPPPHQGGHGSMPPQHIVMAGYHHHHHYGGGYRHPAPPPPPPVYYHSHRGAVIGGVLARRSYWSYPYCDYRLGWYDDFCMPPRYSSGVYVNFGIPIRF